MKLRHLALSIVATLIAALVGIRLYYTDEKVTALVRDQLAKNIPFPVGLGHVELRLLSGIVLSDVVVGPPNAAYQEDVARIREMRLGYRLAPLFSKRVSVSTVLLDEPRFVIEQRDGVWNVEALAKAFAPGDSASDASSKPSPATQPASEGAQPLGFEVDIESVRIQNLAVRVSSPEMNASIDRVGLALSGSYSGDRGAAKGRFTIGDGEGNSAVSVDLGKTARVVALLKLAVDFDAPSLAEASVTVEMLVDKLEGEAANVALPNVPMTLKTKLHAVLPTQTAEVQSLSFDVGDALSVRLAAKVSHFLGDPFIDLSTLDVDTDLRSLTSYVPENLMPGRVSGQLTVSDVRVRGWLSEITGQKPFVAQAKAKWTGLAAQLPAVRVDGVNGSLVANMTPEAGVTLNVQTNVGAVTQASASVRQLGVRLDVQAPADVLASMQTKQRFSRPVLTTLGVDVAEVQAQGAKVSGTTLVLKAAVSDIERRMLSADVHLDVANLAYAQPDIGSVSVPLSFHLTVDQNGLTSNVQALQLKVADLIDFTLHGHFAAQVKNAMEIDSEMTLGDVDLAKALALMPAKLRQELASKQGEMRVSGGVGATVRIKGRLPFDLADRLKTADDLQRLPFTAEAALHWSEVSAALSGLWLQKTSGEVRVSALDRKQTAHANVSLMGFRQGEGATRTEVGDVALAFDGGFDGKKGDVTLNAKVGHVEKPDQLTRPLDNTTAAIALSYQKGAEAAVKTLQVLVPSLGVKLDLHGRLLSPEQCIDKPSLDCAMTRESKTQLTGLFEMNLPERASPFVGQPLTLSGLLGSDLSVELENGIAHVSGALRAKKFSLIYGDNEVRGMSGRLPFQQDLRVVNGRPQPILANVETQKQSSRVAYFDALRSYGRDDDAILIDKIISPRVTIDKFNFNGRLDRGTLLIDQFGLRVLNGDLAGKLLVQLGNDKMLRASMNANFSNLDLSVLSKTQPGEESQVNGNISASLKWSDRIRELDGTNINLTQLGSKLLVKGLLAKDPAQKEESTRSNISKIQTFRLRVKLLSISVIHNILTADLDYSSLADLAFGWKPVPPKLVPPDPPTSVKPFVEEYVGPYIESSFLSQLMGWRRKDEE